MSEKCYAEGSSCPELEKNKIRLYSMRFCPFATRVRIVLAAKNILHAIVNINLKSKPEWYLEKNPSGKVPMLEQDGKMLTESVVISEYLEDVFPENKLHPSDPYLKAKNKLLLEEFDKVVGRIIQALHNKLEADELPCFWSGIQETLMHFEKELETRNSIFFGGCRPGFLDYMIWPWIEMIPALRILLQLIPPFPRSEYPLLSEWIDNMKLDEAVKKTAIDPKLHASFMEANRSGSPDYDIGL